MLQLARQIIATGGIIWAMPMMLPFHGTFLKDLLALGTKDIIPETKILMQK